jgi:hypothetical protein
MNFKKKLFSTKYRIVYDNYGGYGVQYKWWWIPVWQEPLQTFISIDAARRYILGHRHKVVEEYIDE